MTKFFLLGLFGLQSDAVMTAQAQVFDNLPITEAENSLALHGGGRTAEGEPTASNWQSFSSKLGAFVGFGGGGWARYRRRFTTNAAHYGI